MADVWIKESKRGSANIRSIGEVAGKTIERFKAPQ